jgi:uncharacterized spore protein YtfJ
VGRRRLEAEGNVKAIFGQPIRLENHTVIPVAAVEIAIGAGGGVGHGPNLPPSIQAAIQLAKKILPGGWGAGGGGGRSVRIRPVGFIYEKDGVAFVPIETAGKH